MGINVRVHRLDCRRHQRHGGLPFCVYDSHLVIIGQGEVEPPCARVKSDALHTGGRAYLVYDLRRSSIDHDHARLLPRRPPDVEAIRCLIHSQNAFLVLLTYDQVGDVVAARSIHSQDFVSRIATEGHVETIGDRVDRQVLDRAPQGDSGHFLQRAGGKYVQGIGRGAGQVEAVGGWVEGQVVYG